MKGLVLAVLSVASTSVASDRRFLVGPAQSLGGREQLTALIWSRHRNGTLTGLSGSGQLNDTSGGQQRLTGHRPRSGTSGHILSQIRCSNKNANNPSTLSFHPSSNQHLTSTNSKLFIHYSTHYKLPETLGRHSNKSDKKDEKKPNQTQINHFFMKVKDSNVQAKSHISTKCFSLVPWNRTEVNKVSPYLCSPDNRTDFIQQTRPPVPSQLHPSTQHHLVTNKPAGKISEAIKSQIYFKCSSGKCQGLSRAYSPYTTNLRSRRGLVNKQGNKFPKAPGQESKQAPKESSI